MLMLAWNAKQRAYLGWQMGVKTSNAGQVKCKRAKREQQAVKCAQQLMQSWGAKNSRYHPSSYLSASAEPERVCRVCRVFL